jgi:cytochrome b
MTNNEKTVRVWDPIVRLGHWTLVIAFFTAYFTEDDFLTQHVYAGYVVGVVVCVRLLWGFVGPKYARFSDFVRSPAVTRQYLADLMTNRAKRFLGHNPAGGAMIVALLLGISGTVSSGLMLYAIEEGEGPLATWVADVSVPSGAPILISRALADDDDDDDDDGRDTGEEHEEDAREEFWEEIHEIFANLTLFLVGLHIAGVLFSSYAHRENLIKAMISGRKRSEEA